MDPTLLQDWIPAGGATGLLLAAVWMVLTGRIVSGREHDRAIKRIDALEARLAVRDQQVTELMELSRTAVAVMDSLPKVRDTA